MNDNPAISHIRNTGVLRRAAGLTQPMAARYCGVSIRTITRYENEAAPLWYQHLMTYRSGRLPGWEGFKFESGRVWTPANQCVTQQEIEHMRWLIQMLCTGNEELRGEIYEKCNYGT